MAISVEVSFVVRLGSSCLQGLLSCNSLDFASIRALEVIANGFHLLKSLEFGCFALSQG